MLVELAMFSFARGFQRTPVNCEFLVSDLFRVVMT